MKRKITKMRLNMETVRRLSTTDLAAAAGGRDSYVSHHSDCASCSDPPTECLCP